MESQSVEPARVEGRPTPSALALRVAHRTLLRVEEGAYATLALAGELERARLPESARGLTTELVYGSLRQRARLDRALAAYAPRGLRKLDDTARTVLRLGAYQLMFLGVPPHAVVNQAVELLSKLRGAGLAGFCNAILRRLHREGEPPLPAPEGSSEQITAALALRYSLPSWIVADARRRWPQSKDAAELEDFLRALAAPAPTWLRLNPLRGSLDQGFEALRAELPGCRASRPYSALPESVKLEGGFPFGGAAYGAGWFTAQDLGAQLIGRLLLAPSQEGAVTLPAGAVLDACAGVGGKTAHLQALLGPEREIDAADQSARKLELCADHAHRLGCRRVRTIQADLSSPDAPLRPTYAAVVLDAPCSGLGVIRRHPEARWRVTPQLVTAVAKLQRSLLEALSPRVLPGGLLVYSVCSFLDEEGPAQTAAFLRAHPEFVALPPDPGQPPWRGLSEDGATLTDTAAGGALRTWPHRHDADGFYALRMRRKG